MDKLRKKITMQDIADRLSISKNAVSLALNNKPGVSEELREKIFKAAQELNYTDLGLVKEKGNYLLVIIQNYINNFHAFYYQIFSAVEKRAKELGYHAIITSISSEMEESLTLPDLFYEIKFDGILLIGAISREYAVKVLETNIPVVMMIHSYVDLELDYVIQANEEGAYNIVKHLIDKGHRDIGYIGPIRRISSFYERVNGYKRVMEEYGLEINEKHCVIDDDISLLEPNVMKTYVDKMRSYPTAWFCGNDIFAISLIKVLNEKGVAVPDDISVVGFDGIEAAFLITPSLTTVDVKRDLMGAKAVETIIERINNNQGRTKISIYGELILGNSVKQI